MPSGESEEGPDLPIQISQHLMVSVNESHTLLIGGKTSEFNATKGPFIYYLNTCRGGIENGNFLLHSVLKICSCRGAQNGWKMCFCNIWMVPKETWYFNHFDQTFIEGTKLNIGRVSHSVGLIKVRQ